MKIRNFFSLLLALLVIWGCSSEDETGLQFEDQGREVPVFNADSAYTFVERQVELGPRVPNSEGHRQTADMLVDKLSHYAGESNVFRQEFTHEGYDGDTLELVNIIASFNPESRKRIMLSAHWDTRPRADKDSDEPDKPILGADDGASGVGVLLEMARILSENDPGIGIDIILFDGEDYGKEGDTDHYFLGSRYWSENPPVSGYNPRFGILLDMVGGEGARFPQEQNSRDISPTLMEELWELAEEKDLQDRFLDEHGPTISDDHVVVHQITGIPIIDIIRHEPEKKDGQVVFSPYWHTQDDNMEIISKQTLEDVGIVLTEIIYNRFE